MEITAQWVETRWTKASRGGPAAARRNAAPIGFAVPRLPTSQAHVVRMAERDGFVPQESVQSGDDLDLLLREDAGRLRVLTRDPLHSRMPPRPRRPTAVRIAPGEWARWQLNYRSISAFGANDWYYDLHTFNVAYGEIEPELFLGTPTVLVDELGWLR